MRSCGTACCTSCGERSSGQSPDNRPAVLTATPMAVQPLTTLSSEGERPGFVGSGTRGWASLPVTAVHARPPTSFRGRAWHGRGAIRLRGNDIGVVSISKSRPLIRRIP